MPVFVSLVRGINLGARNKVSMPALRDALAKAGFDDVRTYVHSGNVVTRSKHRSATAVATAVRKVVKDCSGVDVPVLVRTPAQLRAVLDWDPFPKQAKAEPRLVHVTHLAKKPGKAVLDALLDQDWAPDDVAVKGLEIVCLYGMSMHDSKLARSSQLKKATTDGTARNWRTLRALVEMTDEA